MRAHLSRRARAAMVATAALAVGLGASAMAASPASADPAANCSGTVIGSEVILSCSGTGTANVWVYCTTGNVFTIVYAPNYYIPIGCPGNGQVNSWTWS